jgi:hypothetical protein
MFGKETVWGGFSKDRKVCRKGLLLLCRRKLAKNNALALKDLLVRIACLLRINILTALVARASIWFVAAKNHNLLKMKVLHKIIFLQYVENSACVEPDHLPNLINCEVPVGVCYFFEIGPKMVKQLNSPLFESRPNLVYISTLDTFRGHFDRSRRYCKRKKSQLYEQNFKNTENIWAVNLFNFFFCF